MRRVGNIRAGCAGRVVVGSQPAAAVGTLVLLVAAHVLFALYVSVCRTSVAACASSECQSLSGRNRLDYGPFLRAVVLHLYRRYFWSRPRFLIRVSSPKA